METKGTLVEIDLTKELCVADEVEVILGDYEFVLKDGKTYFVKKKPQYPKTYEECCEIMGIKYPVVGGRSDGLGASTYRITAIRPLIYLLICRDAYWKIAGDWKFDFDKPCYYLCNEYGRVQKFEGTIDCNAVFTFPTGETRDAFLENFKDLIEQCKELL